MEENKLDLTSLFLSPPPPFLITVSLSLYIYIYIYIFHCFRVQKKKPYSIYNTVRLKSGFWKQKKNGIRNASGIVRHF